MQARETEKISSRKDADHSQVLRRSLHGGPPTSRASGQDDGIFELAPEAGERYQVYSGVGADADISSAVRYACGQDCISQSAGDFLAIAERPGPEVFEGETACRSQTGGRNVDPCETDQWIRFFSRGIRQRCAQIFGHRFFA
jgi:hypothetical protein